MSFLSSLFNKSKPLDSDVQQALASQFNLDDDQIKEWRMVDGSTTLASRKVKLFRVYNPAELADPSKNVTFKSLDGSPKALKFEGQLSSSGRIGECKDVRQPA